MSRPNHSWKSEVGPEGLFLATRTAGVGAFGPFEEHLDQHVGSERVQTTFQSAVCEQATHQQLLRGRPVVGARFRTVSSSAASVVLGGPVADLGQRDPGQVPRHSSAAVAQAVRDQLQVPSTAKIEVERVVWPVEGQGVWAYRARVIDNSEPIDVRAYVRADEELGLLYAQDVSCSASFGEGRVFRSNPARDPVPEVVRLAGLEGRRGVLKTGNLKLIPAVGHALTNAKRDFRLAPAEGGFEEVCAFHHMANAMQFFRDLLGAELFDDEPFGPLTIRVQDRTVSAQVGAFFPGQHMIRLADTPRPAARSGDICMHEFTHAVVHRIARLDDEFASPIARGINEGFADYAQATFFNDPRFGDWVRDEPKGARRCDDKTLRLKADPQDPQDRYKVGAAWAALLWDFRGLVGPGVADAIAFHSLQFLMPRCTLRHCTPGFAPCRPRPVPRAPERTTQGPDRSSLRWAFGLRPALPAIGQRDFPRYPRSVQITVSILGGMMDDDRITSVRGDELVVKDHGKIRVNRRLAPGEVDQLDRLANEVANVIMSKRTHPYAVDGGVTTIEIEADKSTRIELWAGEDAPEPVWALLSAIDALGRDAKSSKY